MLGLVLGKKLKDVYVTNAFPFVKAGGMSASLPSADVREAVRKFALREIEIVKPTAVLALGKVAHSALQGCGVSCIGLPHPAARIGGITIHEIAWRAALSSSGVSLRATE